MTVLSEAPARSTTAPTRLAQIMRAEGVTVAELAELADLSTTTVWRFAADRAEGKVHEETAAALAAALYREVHEIFAPEELTHIGRTPHIHTAPRPGSCADAPPNICRKCCLALPLTGKCDNGCP